MAHWTKDFDWENAEYVLIDMAIGENGGERFGPIKGAAAALCAAKAWRQRINFCCIEIKEVSHRCPVARIDYNGKMQLLTLWEDRSRNKPLPYKVPWDA